MSRTCISDIMRATVRHVWDMHRPRDVSQCKTCLGHTSATR
ncbi:hypothetical protein F383_12364 [Gossypium arboreum]|uniref:Uncharacterized protein n=1 Tax=Gossypium arboreum TaxID=29729 RepID=A0A0B0N9H4_GOSAR|nr:hypothetical protein F383_12364 [Gossypium arboreum]